MGYGYRAPANHECVMIEPYGGLSWEGEESRLDYECAWQDMLEEIRTALPNPVRPGRVISDAHPARQATWLPKGPRAIYRYRELCRSMSPEEAKQAILAEVEAERVATSERLRAERSKPLTFDQQLDLVRQGKGRVVKQQRFGRADPALTLGGVATGML